MWGGGGGGGQLDKFYPNVSNFVNRPELRISNGFINY